ncbi:MAG TPA: ATP-binding protein [Kofleriaceae bacterium]|nr:ATP-binding protein [Kofleriaceae bacterium]
MKPWIIAVLLASLVARAVADPPTRRVFRGYGSEHGLDDLTINALAQTSDGLMWVGTEDGLYAYDGARFIRFAVADGLPSAEVLSLLADGDQLWVGTELGVARLSRGHVVPGSGFGAPSERVLAIARGPDGSVWLATDGGVYVRRAYLAFVADTRWPGGASAALHVMRDGSVVAGCERYLAQRASDGTWRVLGDAAGFGRERIEQILTTSDDHVWVRSARNLWECDGALSSCLDRSDELPDVGEVGRMFVGHDGGLRVATRQGLEFRRGDSWQLVGKADGLPVRSVITAFEDRDGATWIVGDRPYRELGAGQLTAYDASTGFDADTTWVVLRTTDHALWVGTNRGVIEADGDHWRTFPGTEPYTIEALVEDGTRLFAAGTQSRVMVLDRASRTMRVIADLPGNSIETMVLHDGALWVGTWNGGLWRFVETGGRWQGARVALPGGDPREDIDQIIVDAAGRMWVAGGRGLAVLEHGRWRRITTADGLASDAVYYVLARASGEMCVAYDEDSGVTCFRYGDRLTDVRHLRREQGLRSDKIYGLGEDAAHRLYVLEGVGVDILDGGTVHHLSTQNGLVGDDCASRAFWADPDGTVLIGTTRGLARLDTSRGLHAPAPPSTVVLHAALDRSTFSAQLVTPSLAAHDRVEQQVRLRPLESEWRATGTTETIRYPKLAHGDYTLEVRARIGRGAFGPVTTYELSVPAAWWQTWPVRVLAILVIIGAAGAIVAWRVRIAARRESAWIVARSEASFRTLIEQSPDAVFVHRDGVVEYANPSMHALLRDRDGTQVIGRRVLDLVDPADHAAAQGRIAALVAQGTVTPPREFRLNTVDGQRVHVEFWAMPVSFDGRPAVLAIGRDLTERKTIEARLMFSDRMASIGTLAAGIAHEINNPLAYVKASLAHVASELGTVSPSIRGALDDALDGTQRIAAIVGSVSTFSRVEANEQTPVDLPRAITAALRVVSTELNQRCRVESELAATPNVVANEARIGQVVINLLINAAQAMPERPRDENLVTLATRTAPDGRAVIEVRDNGSGMPPEVVRRVFEPFFTTKDVGQGSGLGLAVCHGIVTSYGGEIVVSSAPGQGSTFTVLLPAAAPAAREPAARARASRTTRRAHLLVIDDDARLLGSLCRMLQRSYDVTPCSSGPHALEMLAADASIDAVLCDLMMPGFTGMQLHAELLRTRPALARRIIFMTGGAFTPEAREFVDQQPCVLEKPFEVSAVRALVDELVATDEIRAA